MAICRRACGRSVSVVLSLARLGEVPILIVDVSLDSGSWVRGLIGLYPAVLYMQGDTTTSRNVPSRQSRHINSFNVYTLILYGSIASTLTLRFLRYFSSILYGCRAPVVSSNVITTTGPFELSGFVAGVSDEGPIASVSERVRSVGGVGFNDADGDIDSVGIGVDSKGCTSCGCDVCSCADGGFAALSDVCAVGSVDGSVGAVAEAGNVLISTGLDDNSPCPLPGLEPVCCGALCAGVVVDGGSAIEEAMACSGYCVAEQRQRRIGRKCDSTKRANGGK